MTDGKRTGDGGSGKNAGSVRSSPVSCKGVLVNRVRSGSRDGDQDERPQDGSVTAAVGLDKAHARKRKRPFG